MDELKVYQLTHVKGRRVVLVGNCVLSLESAEKCVCAVCGSRLSTVWLDDGWRVFCPGCHEVARWVYKDTIVTDHVNCTRRLATLTGSHETVSMADALRKYNHHVSGYSSLAVAVDALEIEADLKRAAMDILGTYEELGGAE